MLYGIEWSESVIRRPSQRQHCPPPRDRPAPPHTGMVIVYDYCVYFPATLNGAVYFFCFVASALKLQLQH